MSTLTDVSDARRNQDLEQWVDGALPRLKSHVFTEEERGGFDSVTGVEAYDEGAGAFRTFVDAGLLADWACYEASAERADYERLRSVITSFPRGFRIWFCDVGPVRLPVGYTGYYPIAPDVFSTACDRPQELKHRGALRPRPDLTAQRPPIWIFNYSIITQLRRSAQSKAMLGSLAADLSSTPNSGLAAAVLSEASKRVVGRFAMTYRGDMTHDGEPENVYAFRA